MQPFLSRITSFSRFSSPGLASVEIAALKEAITQENDDAVLRKLQNTNLSPETVQGLLEHAFEKNSSPAIKQTLLQHPNCHPLSALALAVTHNDLSSAKQALLQGADPEKITTPFPSSGDMRTLLTYVRRKNKLYPPDASPAQETALDHALRDAWLSDEAKKMANSLLDLKIQGRDISDVWRDAVENRQLDLQRAILLLKADTNRKFRVKQKAQVTDKGVAEVMKEIPCFSPKRGLPRNFNRKRNFRDADNKLIECRHLVEHRQQVQEQDPQGKFNDEHFASKKAIKTHVSYDTEAKYSHLENHATEVHLRYNSDFGKVLVEQLVALAAEGEPPRSKLIMLQSTNHAMSVRLRVKEERGELRYVAELFDPNHTNSHVRVASASLHAFETLTLKDFIDTAALYQRYYRESDKESDKFSAIFVRPSPQTEQSMTTTGQEGAKNRKLTSNIEKINPTSLWYMLALDLAEDLKCLKNKITIDEELLAAKDADRFPGLFMALQNGHANAITAFGELLKLVPSEKDRAKLLAAEAADGTPGLYAAFDQGRADAIEAFGELLKLVSSEDERIKLLAAKDADGTPGLYAALEEGNADAIKAFGELLKLVSSEDECANLLAAKNADGTPGLYMALEEGNADAIKAFGELLKLVSSEDECANLLAAKNADGTPGLYMALEEGNADAIKAFGELLKLVPPQKRAELLAAKDADGLPGFHMALQEGHADAIKAFGELLELAQPEERAKLLIAKDPAGNSAFAAALEDGKLEALKQYMAIVKDMAPSLSPEERAGLLKYIRKSHGEKIQGQWFDFSFFLSLIEQDPDFYFQFKEMTLALKSKS